MVAMFVLSLGVLGLAALQMTSLRFNQSAQLRTQATLLAGDIFDCIRANQSAASSYVTAFNDGAPAGTATYQLDLANWKQRITNLLGAGAQGSVSGPDGEGKYTVRIKWSDAGEANSGRVDQTFVYVAVP